ncbi:MAG: tetratricopeptide repeat protein, partial [Sphingobacteriales bacterium]
YEAAVAEYKKALSAAKSLKIKGEAFRSLGLVTTFMSDYTLALEYDMQALKASEAAKDRKGQAAVLSNIGIIYYDLKQARKAIGYYEKARVINQEMGNLAYLSNNLGNLGNCFSMIGEVDQVRMLRTVVHAKV